jgi:predicted MFS family arabinose efflux permease
MTAGKGLAVKYIQIIGLTICIFGLFLMGPSLFFGGAMPDKIWVIFVGLFLMGWGVAWVYALVALEIINSKGDEIKERWAAAFEKEGYSEREVAKKVKKQWKVASPILADRAAALNEMSFAFGSLIGPVIGGKLTDMSGYRHMTDDLCLACIGAVVLNFCCLILPDFFITKKKMVDDQEDDQLDDKNEQIEFDVDKK